MQAIEVAQPKTDEWYAARKTGIGASEIAAAAGLSRYSTPFEVYCRKRGELPEFEGNAATRLGNKLEPIVVSEFVESTGINVRRYPVPMLRHPKFAFVLATPDAELESDEVLEVKTTNWRVAKVDYGDEDSDFIPQEYLCQAQIQMAVTGYLVCRFAVLVDGRELKTYQVERNDSLIDGLIGAASDLWKRIENGDPPEPTWHHPSTLDLMKDLYRNVDPGKVVSLSDAARDAWAKYEELGKQSKQISDDRDAAKARVLAEIGDAAAGDLADGRCVRRSVIEKAPYTVTPTPYVDVRAVKLATFMKG